MIEIRNVKRTLENLAAGDAKFSAEELDRIHKVISEHDIKGDRYTEGGDAFFNLWGWMLNIAESWTIIHVDQYFLKYKDFFTSIIIKDHLLFYAQFGSSIIKFKYPILYLFSNAQK